MIRKTREEGFTIVELMLAMALLAFIVVFTLTVLMQLVTTYNRGLTLTQINQATRELDNDIAKGFQFLSPQAVTVSIFDKDGKVIQGSTASELSSSDATGNDGANANNVQTAGAAVAGAICVDNNSTVYLWNIGQFHGFQFNGGKYVRLVRITNDPNICKAIANLKSNDSVFGKVGPIQSSSDETITVTNLLGAQSMVLAAAAYQIPVDNTVGSTSNYEYNSAVDTGNGSKILGLDKGDCEKVTDGVSAGVWRNNQCYASVAITARGNAFRVYFALSSFGHFVPKWEDSTPNDDTTAHLTCATAATDRVNGDSYCSFGEFNSIIYMRGK
jgi:type II secretory pathway pseudopilin PulG